MSAARLTAWALALLAGCRTQPAEPPGPYEHRLVLGWQVSIRRELLQGDARATTERALAVLHEQLAAVERLVPPAAVAQLRQVPLWLSPEYPGTPPTAEYHPAADWLAAHGRDPAMARGVEFTDLRDFAAEAQRMPVFVLHELAHAYHDRVLPDGFANAAIRAAWERARASGSYDRVERRDAQGRIRLDRAYALTNPQEYFAECTEAFFAHNDFFPWTRRELQQVDAPVCALLAQVWGVPADTAATTAR